MSDYSGVILAAGRGKRMGALGEQFPKALLPVGDEPLIGHQLRLFRRLGITEVFVVIGYLGSRVAEVVGTGEKYGLAIQYIDQGPPLGSAFALARVKPYLHRPFLVALGDYYFEASEAERLIGRLKSGASAIAAKCEPSLNLLMEACELRVSADGHLRCIIEKPSAPSGNLKGCGFYAFQTAFLDSVACTPRTALRDEYELSVSLDVHLSLGHTIYVEDIVEADWNFTRARDVLCCNLHWLQRRQERAFVSSDVQIDNATLLEDVVVGRGAHLSCVECLRQVVVFPGAELENESLLESALVTPQGLHRV
jgi:dTDP-glucose pyrophosphorylase